MSNIPRFKARCSRLGQIMTNPTGKTNLDLYNDEVEKLSKFKIQYDAFKNKECKSAVEIITQKIPNTEIRIKELELIKDVVMLSSTCISYLTEWILEKKYGRRKEFSNKYLEKGLDTEQDGFQLIQDLLFKGSFLPKNKEYFENDYFTGNPDVIIDDIVIDNKSSWSLFTFPLGETEIPDKQYNYQLHGYMSLVGLEKAMLCYTLNDTPSHLVEDEIWRYKRSQNLIDISDEKAYEIVKNNVFTKEGLMNCKYLFGNADISDFIEVPIEKRLVSFEIERNDHLIDEMWDRVNLCNKWVQENWDKY